VSTFRTRNQTVMRIASKHVAVISKAIEEINAVIDAHEDHPIKFDASLLGDIESVRQELIRKLKEEACWSISFESKGAYIGVLTSEVDKVVLDIKWKSP
jgi:hypothetical protein